jgi:hypothetical protein
MSAVDTQRHDFVEIRNSELEVVRRFAFSDQQWPL